MLPSLDSCTLAALLRGLHTMPTSVDDLLRRAVENKSSDLHLKVGNHPYLRVDGLLTPLTDVPRVTPEEMLSMAFSMMTNRQKQKFKETAELDMAYGVAGPRRVCREGFPQPPDTPLGPRRPFPQNAPSP